MGLDLVRLTSTLRKIIEQHFIGGWWPTVQDDNGIIMGVEDSVPAIYEGDI